MIHATVHINLPSVEAERELTFFEWVRTLFGARIDRASGFEELTVSTLSLVEGCQQALQRCGVTDVLSLLVDRRAVYLDRDNLTDDLSLAFTAMAELGLLNKPLRELHLALAEEHGELRYLYDIGVVARVQKGRPELTLRVEARPLALTLRPYETAAGFAARVQDFVETHPEAALTAQVDARVRPLAEALGRALVGAEVEIIPASVRLTQPDARALGAMRHLPFGDDVASPAFRGVPARGAYGGSPMSVYYADPYWSLTQVMLMSSVSAAWHQPSVVVVDRSGGLVGGLGEVSPATSAVDWSGPGLAISEDVPSAEADGWGGSDLGVSESGAEGEGSTEGDGDGGWGGSDTSSDSSDSGSSDSGGSDGGSSSCGSSCGGGCGGGGD